MTKTDFIKNKWYKNLGVERNFIAKFDKIDGERFITRTGHIYNNKYRIDTSDGKITVDWSNAIECPLEEIQQYLPDGHPDKIIEFVLPEKWYVLVTKENRDILTKWKHTSEWKDPADSYKWISSNGAGLTTIDKDYQEYIEISFEQFKKYILKEETTPMQTNFDNCKIWIGNNPELSREVQEKLFELGYGWSSGTKFIVDYTYGSSLFLYPYNTLSYGRYNKSDFDNEPKKEIFPEDLGILSTKIEPKLTLSNLIAGKIYYLDYTDVDSKYILKSTGGNKSDHSIRIHDKKYSSYKGNEYDLDHHRVRLATPEEKQWLNVCIAESKFIDKDVALKNYYSDGTPMMVSVKAEEFKVGEWVYALEDPEDDYRDSRYIPIFQIQEISKQIRTYLRPEKGKVSGILERCCRKATKEEVDSVTKVKFEVGDWIKQNSWNTCYKLKAINYAKGNLIIDCPEGDEYGKYPIDLFRLATKKEIASRVNKVSEFKIGDWVTILKSDQDWADNGEMDKFVGRTVQITEVYLETQIRFKDDEDWTWNYRNKHFRPATLGEIEAAQWNKIIYPSHKLEVTGTVNFGIGMIDACAKPYEELHIYPEVTSKRVVKIEPVKGIIQEVKEY